jgi:gas vesicle protein
MTMKRVDDQDERQWLGGEAHVRLYNGRPRLSSLRRWLASENIPLLAGVAAVCAAIGSLGTVGVMRTEHESLRRRIDERSVRASSERSGSMEQVRSDERQVRGEAAVAMDVGTVLAAFGLGLLAGAAVTLLTTPESGASVRKRLKRGVDTARQELDQIAGETKESWKLVRDDAREAAKRTTTRIKEAVEVTKKALAEGETSVPKAP